MPAAEGLFRQAIIQSGTGVGSVVDTPDEATKVADAVLAEAGGDLCELPAEQIVEAQQRVGLASGTMVTYRVVVDGTVLPRRPGEVKAKVPVLIGTTHDEQDLFHMLTKGGARLLGSGSTVLNPEELATAAAAYRELLPDWSAELAERHAFTAGGLVDPGDPVRRVAGPSRVDVSAGLADHAVRQGDGSAARA